MSSPWAIFSPSGHQDEEPSRLSDECCPQLLPRHLSCSVISSMSDNNMFYSENIGRGWLWREFERVCVCVYLGSPLSFCWSSEWVVCSRRRAMETLYLHTHKHTHTSMHALAHTRRHTHTKGKLGITPTQRSRGWSRQKPSSRCVTLI